jgi:hypothetical protein
MDVLRARMPWLAGTWLLCQIAGFIAAPVVFGATVHTYTAGVGDAECECPGTAPGQACPMHKSKSHDDDRNACQLRSACSSADTALLTLSTGGIAVMPAPSSVVVDLAAQVLAGLALSPLTRAALPDAPPPRA